MTSPINHKFTYSTVDAPMPNADFYYAINCECGWSSSTTILSFGRIAAKIHVHEKVGQDLAYDD